MIENILYGLTQISLLCGAVAVLFDALFFDQSQRHSLKIAKISVLTSCGFNILFYNKSFYPPFFEMSSFTAFSYFVMSLISYAILSRSVKWFSFNNTLSSSAYSFLILLLLASYSLFITTTYWAALIVISLMILLLQYLMLRLSHQSEELYNLSKKYGRCALMIFLFFCAFVGYMVYHQISFSADVSLLTDQTIKTLLALLLLVMFFFLMGVAPFHFALTDCVSHTSLPIACYFHLVPLFGVAATFLKYQPVLESLSSSQISKIYLIFGILSIIFGVIGIHSTRFLKQIFAAGYLYMIGIWFVFLFFHNQDNVAFSLIYLSGYLIAAVGADTCLFSFKSGSQDIDHLGQIAGLFSLRPYLASAFILFVLSLSGLPPFLGFVTSLSILQTIALSPWLICFILAAALLILPAYLKIIHTVSYLQKEQTFDRVDFSTYVWLLFYAALMIFLMFRPVVFFQIAHFV